MVQSRVSFSLHFFLSLCISLLLQIPASEAKATDWIQIIKKQIRLAESCMPKQNSSGVQLCTGAKITTADFKKLSVNDFDGCLREIKKRNYLPIQGEALKSDPDHLPFLNSTKQAETVHDKKQVLFKSQSGNVDCFHELLHVIQWTDVNSSELSPLRRKKIERLIDQEIQASVEIIDELEGQGKRTQAHEKAKKTQPLVDALANYQAIYQWLDEKEVYSLILENCSTLHCTGEDREIAITNLFALQKRLPAAYAEKIKKEAQKVIEQKQTAAMKSAQSQWKKLDPIEKKNAARWITLSWEQLIKEILAEDAKIAWVSAAGILDVPALAAGFIPDLHLKSLPPASEEIENQLISSQLKQGKALGKLVCSPSGQWLILSQNSTRGALIHEFLHWKQSLSNPLYCPAVTDQPQIEADFKAGKISRKQYENQVLLYQAINQIAEKEVYEIMISLAHHQTPFERENDREMLKKYSTGI